MADVCNVCGTGITPCKDEGHRFEVFKATVPSDHYIMMCSVRRYFNNTFKRGLNVCTSDGTSCHFNILEREGETFLHGIGWDNYGCDYAIRRGDTLTFTMQPKRRPVLLAATASDGQPRFMAASDFFHGRRIMVSSNDINLGRSRTTKLNSILNKTGNDPEQIQRITATNIDDDIIKQRGIESRLEPHPFCSLSSPKKPHRTQPLTNQPPAQRVRLGSAAAANVVGGHGAGGRARRRRRGGGRGRRRRRGGGGSRQEGEARARLTREQREVHRFRDVLPKDDCIYFKRVKGHLINILAGLEHVAEFMPKPNDTLAKHLFHYLTTTPAFSTSPTPGSPSGSSAPSSSSNSSKTRHCSLAKWATRQASALQCVWVEMGDGTLVNYASVHRREENDVVEARSNELKPFKGQK